MSDYTDFEKKVEENCKRNEKFIKGFEKWLIEKGADVNAADNNGKTVLMYAAAGGDIGKVRLLIDAGAKTGAKTQDGKTAADFAKSCGPCFVNATKGLWK